LGQELAVIPPDDLKPGMFVAIIAYDAPEQLSPDGTLVPAEPTRFSGMPLRIMSVSFPFVILTDGHENTGALDTRRYKFVKLSMHYAKTWEIARLADGAAALFPSKWYEAMQLQAAPAAPEPNADCCPTCGRKYRQRLVKQGQWERRCPQCGFQPGEPVRAA
jgi:hypothetical protein